MEQLHHHHEAPELEGAHAPPPNGRGKALEIATAVILSAAGLLTSWSSFQSVLWEGRQAAHYSAANILRTQASTAQLQADARRAIDVNLFSAWLNAEASGHKALANFYSSRFPPDLRKAFDAWMQTRPFTNPDAPPSPFHGHGVQWPGQEQAAKFGEQAEHEFEAGLQANRVADDFAQATVFFAITLFFGGIAQVFRYQAARMALLAVAVVACIVAVLRLAGLPWIRPG